MLATKKLWVIGIGVALLALVGLLRPWHRSGEARAGAVTATAATANATAANATAANATTAAATTAGLVGGGAQLHLTAAALANNPVAITAARRQATTHDLSLVGSVTYDADHYAIVGPLISGRIVALHAGSGDRVRKNQVLAELESPEIGAAQAAFLEARARLAAAQSNLRRERELAAAHVSSDRERELAEAQASSEQAALDAARQRLESLGFRGADLKLAAGAGGRVAVRSPLDGVVISREVTLGQAVQAATDAFRVADLSHLWVNLDVYEKDLEAVHVDQAAEVRTESLPGRLFSAHVAYVEPHVDEKTRTARVRIEMENPNGALRPGQFVSAQLRGDPDGKAPPVLAVARRAVVGVDGKQLVFLRRADNLFEARTVELGATGGEFVEVLRGLVEGDPVVSEGAFLLKSELLR